MPFDQVIIYARMLIRTTPNRIGKFERLVEAYTRATRTVPLHSRTFGATAPDSWEAWAALPCTDTDSYRGVPADSYSVVGADLYGPIAPLDLDFPTFPTNTLISVSEFDTLTRRVEHLIAPFDHLRPLSAATVVGWAQKYAGCELIDHLTQLHIPSQLLTAKTSTLRVLAPSIVFWMSDSQPPIDGPFPVLTFNRHRSENNCADVLHFDHVPYFAVSVDGHPYRWPSDQFHVELTHDNEIVITTLYSAMIPLLRFATGLRAIDLTENGIRLSPHQ